MRPRALEGAWRADPEQCPHPKEYEIRVVSITQYGLLGRLLFVDGLEA
jgi:hypothetical protein